MAKGDQSAIWLWILLVWYCSARVLQLFAGEIPNLFIVLFHVVPPALFAGLHGRRVYGSDGMSVFVMLCLVIASFFEIVSLRTGFPFGYYRFTDLMGPKLFGLPVLLALAYVGMGYLSWIVALVLLGYEDEALSGRRVIWLPPVASLVMTAWDLSMDPVWAGIDHGWVWRDGGLYFGVPISNFLGWLLTVYSFYQLFALYLRRRATGIQPESRMWQIAILFYGASAIGNLFVVAPAAMGPAFVDATGKPWPISEILWASRIVSVLVMLPLSLIAWMRVSRPLNR